MTNNGQPYETNIENLPGYVTAQGPGADFASVAYGFPGYGLIDNPTVVGGADLEGGAAISVLPAADPFSGASVEVMTFTVLGLAETQTVRVGVLSGVEGSLRTVAGIRLPLL